MNVAAVFALYGDHLLGDALKRAADATDTAPGRYFRLEGKHPATENGRAVVGTVAHGLGPRGSPMMRYARTVFRSAVFGLGLLAGRLAAAQEPGAEAVTQIERRLVETIARCEKSVVAIACVRKPKARPDVESSPFFPAMRNNDDWSQFVPNEYGTGVVIDRQGLILTAYHVLGDLTANDYYVRLPRPDARPLKIERVKAADPWMDLAVLKIPADDLDPIAFGDGSKVKKGQFVVALGNPAGIIRDGEASASWGMISGLSRAAPVRPGRDATRETVHQLGTLIQADVRQNLGPGGGPLVNLNGEMIGLMTSLAAAPAFDQAAGYAIPVDDDFRRVVDKLKQGRMPEYGFLGIGLGPLPRDIARRGRHGVLIERVIEGTPAQRDDLLADDTITEVNGRPVFDPNALIRDLSKLPSEGRVTLTLERGQPPRVLRREVVLAKRYIEPSRAAWSEEMPPRWRGLQVDYSTATPDPQQLGASVPAVVVTDVDRESPAWKAGIRVWTFITHADGQPVATPAEFHARVGDKNGPVRLQQRQLERTWDVTVTP